MAPKRPKTTFPARLEDSRALFFRDDDKYARLLYARVRYEISFVESCGARFHALDHRDTTESEVDQRRARRRAHPPRYPWTHKKRRARKKGSRNERDNNKGARFLSASIVSNNNFQIKWKEIKFLRENGAGSKRAYIYTSISIYT